MKRHLDRRAFLQSAGTVGLGLVAPPLRSEPDAIVNDGSTLNPVRVARVIRPTSADQIRELLRAHKGPVSIGGGRFSMGGQIVAPDSLHLDMRLMNRIVAFSPGERVIRVAAGATWRDIQDRIDGDNLSVKIMQSYSNFTVGGSVSVNCHGRYVGKGALINSIRALQVVTANGETLELSRTENAELFRAVVGGYGGLAIITEVELDLDPNEKIEQAARPVSLEEYPAYFQREILGNPSVVFHNADLSPPDFDKPLSISWTKSAKPLTQTQRLVPRGQKYSLEKNMLFAISELPGGDELRKWGDSIRTAPAVVWRNYEASLDTESLEPRTRIMSTYLLQEYFIPVQNFLPFARAMSKILRDRDSWALNVSIRHAPADRLTLLSWAPVDVFCFVVYFKQRVSDDADFRVSAWTRELVEAALANGGRYYLPYRLHPTPGQFLRAYPEARTFAKLKKKIDPDNRLRNLLWDKYLADA